MKKLLIVFAGIMFLLSVYSQDAEIKTVKKNEFGFNAGPTTGLGLSYRHWFGKVGFQLTGLPIKTENATVYSAAFTALYNFYDAQHIRVYGFLGNHYFVTNEETTVDFWDNGTYSPYTETSKNESYNIGIGPGFAFGSVVRFNLMAGYGFYDVLDEVKMFPTVEIGVYYNF
jgi:hypothetical protein